MWMRKMDEKGRSERYMRKRPLQIHSIFYSLDKEELRSFLYFRISSTEVKKNSNFNSKTHQTYHPPPLGPASLNTPHPCIYENHHLVIDLYPLLTPPLPPPNLRI